MSPPESSAASGAWTLHQTSREPLPPALVNWSLSQLPVGTRYAWHSDKDVEAFVLTQPRRFQTLFAQLVRIEHRIDLWRYLYLHQRGGIYLDEDNVLVGPALDAGTLDSIDAAFVYDAQFRNVHNGLLVARAGSPALLATAESMVALGPEAANGGGVRRFQYNLRLLRAELENLIEPPDPDGSGGTQLAELLPTPLIPRRDSPLFPRRCSASRYGADGSRARSGSGGDEGALRPIGKHGRWNLSRARLYYADSCGWRTLVFTRRGPHGYRSDERGTTLVRLLDTYVNRSRFRVNRSREAQLSVCERPVWTSRQVVAACLGLVPLFQNPK